MNQLIGLFGMTAFDSIAGTLALSAQCRTNHYRCVNPYLTNQLGESIHWRWICQVNFCGGPLIWGNEVLYTQGLFNQLTGGKFLFRKIGD
jgi:hypothetical protein